MDPATERLDDEELLHRARRDGEAFRAFYQRHVDATYRMMRASTRSSEDALDLTAETFAQALSSLRRFRSQGPGSGRSWLAGIARNQLRMYAREHRVQEQARLRVGMSVRWHDDELAEIDSRIDATRLAESAPVAQALDALSGDQREALALRVDDEMPYEQVAESLSVTPEVARSRVSRALASVRAALKGPS